MAFVDSKLPTKLVNLQPCMRNQLGAVVRNGRCLGCSAVSHSAVGSLDACEVLPGAGTQVVELTEEADTGDMARDAYLQPALNFDDGQCEALLAEARDMEEVLAGNKVCMHHCIVCCQGSTARMPAWAAAAMISASPARAGAARQECGIVVWRCTIDAVHARAFSA